MGALVSVLIIILVIVGGAFLLMYNGLISKKNQVEQSFSSVDVMLKKRHDLIPNLVATVERYMTHERDLLTEVTELRTRAISGDIPLDRRVELENRLGDRLGQLMLSFENYPELKSNENFLHLQASLNEVEEQISAARRAYNASVTEYNNAVEMLPTSIMAQMMSLRKRPWFTATETERQAVDVRSMFQQ